MTTLVESGTGRQKNRRGEGAQLKQELILAAMRVLDSTPGVQLSLRLVAREAGVSAPSVYRHFADAQTMMSAIVRECWNQLATEMTNAANEMPVLDERMVLKAQLYAYVRYALERPSRYQLLFAMQSTASGSDDGLPGIIQPAFRKIRENLRAVREQGGTLPAKDSFSAALTILSLVHGRIGLAHLAPQREGNSTVGVQAFISEVLDIFVPE